MFALDAGTAQATRYLNDRHYAINESFTLLTQALTLVAPEPSAPLQSLLFSLFIVLFLPPFIRARPLLSSLFTLPWFAAVIGMFELNNHSVEIESPLTGFVSHFPILQVSDFSPLLFSRCSLDHQWCSI